jgi:hypothetical protein
LVRRTGSLSDTRVQDESALNFCGGETMTRDIDDIVDTAPDPDITIGISSSAITSEVVARVRLLRRQHPGIRRGKV